MLEDKANSGLIEINMPKAPQTVPGQKVEQKPELVAESSTPETKNKASGKARTKDKKAKASYLDRDTIKHLFYKN